VRFYADVLRDKNVVINLFFADCRGACPRMAGTMGKIRDRLGDRVGKDVFLVSLTVDPDADTPASLKAFAEGLKAPPGWSFLSGPRADVEAVVRKLHPQFAAKDAHSTCFFIGNLRSNTWARPDVASHGDDQIIEAAERIWGEGR
jgi:protein SCO1/2